MTPCCKMKSIQASLTFLSCNVLICLPIKTIVKGHDKFPEADLFFEKEIMTVF